VVAQAREVGERSFLPECAHDGAGRGQLCAPHPEVQHHLQLHPPQSHPAERHPQAQPHRALEEEHHFAGGRQLRPAALPGVGERKTTSQRAGKDIQDSLERNAAEGTQLLGRPRRKGGGSSGSEKTAIQANAQLREVQRGSDVLLGVRSAACS
jgi:hypothetical protein